VLAGAIKRSCQHADHLGQSIVDMVEIPALPEGNLGVAVKVALAVLGAFWWTSGPGADEAR